MLTKFIVFSSFFFILSQVSFAQKTPAQLWNVYTRLYNRTVLSNLDVNKGVINELPNKELIILAKKAFKNASTSLDTLKKLKNTLPQYQKDLTEMIALMTTSFDISQNTLNVLSKNKTQNATYSEKRKSLEKLVELDKDTMLDVLTLGYQKFERDYGKAYGLNREEVNPTDTSRIINNSKAIRFNRKVLIILRKINLEVADFNDAISKNKEKQAYTYAYNLVQVLDDIKKNDLEKLPTYTYKDTKDILFDIRLFVAYSNMITMDAYLPNIARIRFQKDFDHKTDTPHKDMAFRYKVCVEGVNNFTTRYNTLTEALDTYMQKNIKQ